MTKKKLANEVYLFPYVNRSVSPSCWRGKMLTQRADLAVTMSTSDNAEVTHFVCARLKHPQCKRWGKYSSKHKKVFRHVGFSCYILIWYKIGMADESTWTQNRSFFVGVFGITGICSVKELSVVYLSPTNTIKYNFPNQHAFLKNRQPSMFSFSA